MPLNLCRDCHALEDGFSPACSACKSRRRAVHEELDTLDIAHLDCDAFYAMVEKRDNPALADKPVLVGHPGGRGVVTTACYVARRFGPRSAMPMFKALRLCPQAVVIPPDMAKYKRVSGDIRQIMAEVTDCIEPVSLDEAYLDLTSAHRVSDALPAVALSQLQARVEREVGITVSIGLSYNKFLAKLASDLEKPRGLSAIGRAEARDFLAGLDVGRIHGVGAATRARMTDEGFELVSDLQALDERAMVARFGKFGHRLFQFVNGGDDRPVTPERETKSISAETTFERDQASFEPLAASLDRLSDRVAQRLVRSGLATRAVVLKLKTADFQTLTRSRQLGRATTQPALIADAGRQLLARECDGRAFRLVGIGASELVPLAEADVPDLFDVAHRPRDQA
jgi:DNA polymerase-4